MQVRDVDEPASVPVVGHVPGPGLQTPVQLEVEPQSLPFRAVMASAGQTAPTPSHRSGASQVFVDARHSTLEPRMEQVPTLPARLHT